MEIKTPKNPQPKAAKSAQPRRLPLVLSLMLMSISAVVSLLSLLSFNYKDSSILFDTTSAYATSNWLGTFGANLSGILLYFFGYSAFLIPFILLYAIKIKGEYLLSLDDTKQYNNAQLKSPWKGHLDRFLGLVFLLPLSATIANLYSTELFTSICPGGLCGVITMHFLSAFLSEAHIPLFLFVLTWATLVVIARFSFITYLYPVGRMLAALPVWHWLYAGTQKVFTAFSSLKQGPAHSHDIPDIAAAKPDTPQTLFQKPRWERPDTLSTQNMPQKSMSKTAVEPVWEDSEIEPAYEEKIIHAAHQTAHIGLCKTNDSTFSVPHYTLFPQPKELPSDALTLHDGEQRAATLEHKLERFGIKGKVVSITQGPVVTLFEYQPSIDTKISTIVAREDDLALALQALSLRIIAPIPGRSVIGFEVAHANDAPYFFIICLKVRHFLHLTVYSLLSWVKIPLVMM